MNFSYLLIALGVILLITIGVLVFGYTLALSIFVKRLLTSFFK